MEYSDTKANLSSLRKLYFELNKIVSESAAYAAYTPASNHDALWIIVSTEGAIRLGKAKIDTPDLLSLMQTFAQKCSKLRPPVYEAERISQFLASKDFLILQKQLKRNEKLINQFDERISGYFYQFSKEAARFEALARIQSSNKRSSLSDLVHFTQLYTPDWVADFLLQESLLAQWKAGLATPAAIPAFKPNLCQGELQADELNLLDPSCGAGHILVKAFDLFMKLHLAEGRGKSEACKIILNQNLSGCDLDDEALQICAFSLMLKALHNEVNFTELNPQLFSVCNDANGRGASSCEEDFERGSLEREWPATHALARRFRAVVTNPPYIGRRLLDRRMKRFLKSEYPFAQHDLSAAFLVRALELTESEGKVAFITQSSLLYLPSYEQLRKQFIAQNTIDTIVELGTRIFPLSSGEKINSMLIVLRNSVDKPTETRDKNHKHKDEFQVSKFLDLTRTENKLAALKNPQYSQRDCRDFLANRSYAFNYKYPEFLSRMMDCKPKLGDLTDIRQGLATGDNARFVRYFWDVHEDELALRWKPYVKGAGSERWYAPCHTVLDWGSDGAKLKAAVADKYPYLKGKIAWVVKNESYYFRRGLTFSFVSTGNFALRKMQEGCIFDVGGSALFCNEAEENFILAYLNSSFASLCAHVLNPTLNSQVGDIKQIPFPQPDALRREKLKALAEQAYLCKRELYKFDVSSPDFEKPDFLDSLLLETRNLDEIYSQLKNWRNLLIEKLESIEQEIDQLILEAVQEKHTLATEDRALLAALLGQETAERRSNYPGFTSMTDFAEFVLHNAIFYGMKDSPVLVTDLQEPLKTIVENKLRSALQEAFDMSLSDYLLRLFNRWQEKIFFNCPRMVCTLDSNSNKLVLFSSRGLRIFGKSETLPVWGSSEDNKTAREILVSIANIMRSIPDWTGRDLSKQVHAKFLRAPMLRTRGNK